MVPLFTLSQQDALYDAVHSQLWLLGTQILWTTHATTPDT